MSRKTRVEPKVAQQIKDMLAQIGNLITEQLQSPEHEERITELASEEGGIVISAAGKLDLKTASLDVKISYTQQFKDSRHWECPDPNQLNLFGDGTRVEFTVHGSTEPGQAAPGDETTPPSDPPPADPDDQSHTEPDPDYAPPAEAEAPNGENPFPDLENPAAEAPPGQSSFEQACNGNGNGSEAPVAQGPIKRGRGRPRKNPFPLTA